MNTNDLAKELDGLARVLRGMSREAQDVFANQLALGPARNASHHTLLAIKVAIEGAKKSAGVRARVLRKDVFDRRIETLSAEYACKLAGLARAKANPIPGDVLTFRFTGRPAGSIWYGDAVGYDHTPIAAEVYGWERAARYAIVRLIPAYGRHELERAAAVSVGLVGNEGGPRLTQSWRIAEQYVAVVDKWVGENAQLRVRLEAGGKVAQVWGVDPKPYSDLLAAVAAGNADPIGVFATREVMHA